MLSITGDKRFDRLTWLAIGLLAIVLSTHLVYLPVDPRDDEVRRALVTLEMMMTGDYLTPTLYGELYLNKPPLYNWILLASFRIFGANELALRIPMLVALFFFGWIIFRFASKWLDSKTGVLAALFFITNGRILFYDSLMGLIDIFYSSLVYLCFMLAYGYYRKANWSLFYVAAYALTAVGYMLKGLPSLVFLVILFGAIAVHGRSIRFLFKPQHLYGLAVLLIVLGSYYAVYFSKNNITGIAVLRRLVTESTMRTFIKSPATDLSMHLLSYPFLFIYHYFPWTLYLFLLFRRNAIDLVKGNSFIWYNVLLFIPAFAMYYVSPYVIPRYLFMILPLLFTVLAWQYQISNDNGSKLARGINVVIIGLLMAIGAACFVLPFLEIAGPVSFRFLKAFAIGLALLLFGWIALVDRRYSILHIVIAVIIIRMGFNWFVIAQRGQYQREQQSIVQQVIAKADSAGMRLYLEKGADLGNADHFAYSYMQHKNEILYKAHAADSTGLFVTDSTMKMLRQHKVLLEWSGPYQPNLYLVEYVKP